VDEVHFQQHGSRCRMWIPPEDKEPVLYHEPTRNKVGYFGAVRLRDGKLVYRRETTSFNAESFWNFLKQLRKASSRSGKKVIIILDNVRYHHGTLHKQWRNDNKKTFQLLFLPAYSPELNTIERLWKTTRRLCTHNRYFESLDQVIDVIESQFHIWTKPNETLRKLCAFN
jgi:transposase